MESILTRYLHCSPFKQFFDVDLIGEYVCRQVLNLTIHYGLVTELNETEAEVGYQYIHENHNQVEEILLQDWAYLCLLSTAVVGVFAVLSILRKVARRSGDDRPRDYKIKCAAASKLSRVMKNTLNLHEKFSASKGGVMVRKLVTQFRSVNGTRLVLLTNLFCSETFSSMGSVRWKLEVWCGH